MNTQTKSLLLTSFLVFSPLKASWEAFALTTAGTFTAAAIGGIRHACTNPEQTRAAARSLLCCWSRDPHATSRLSAFFPDSMPWETARMLNHATNALEYICPDRNKTILADGMSFQTSTYLFDLRRGFIDDPDPLNPGENESTSPRLIARTKNRIKGAARRTGKFGQAFFDRIDEAVHREHMKLLVRTDPDSGQEDLFALIYGGFDPVSGEALNFVVKVSLPEPDDSSQRERHQGRRARRDTMAAPAMARAATTQPRSLRRDIPDVDSVDSIVSAAAAASCSGDAKESSSSSSRGFRMGTFTKRFQTLAQEAQERLAYTKRDGVAVPGAAAGLRAAAKSSAGTPVYRVRPSLSTTTPVAEAHLTRLGGLPKGEPSSRARLSMGESDESKSTAPDPAVAVAVAAISHEDRTPTPTVGSEVLPDAVSRASSGTRDALREDDVSFSI